MPFGIQPVDDPDDDQWVDLNCAEIQRFRQAPDEFATPQRFFGSNGEQPRLEMADLAEALCLQQSGEGFLQLEGDLVTEGRDQLFQIDQLNQGNGGRLIRLRFDQSIEPSYKSVAVREAGDCVMLESILQLALKRPPRFEFLRQQMGLLSHSSTQRPGPEIPGGPQQQ